MASQRSILLDLPPEIVEMTAEYLPARSLLGLRLLSREVSSRTERPMLKANFTDLHVRFSLRSSLRNALWITKHPKLGQAIRSVTVYEGHFDLDALHDVAFLGKIDWDDASAVASRRAERAKFFELAEDAGDLVHTRSGRTMLREIFDNLASSSNRLSVTLTDAFSYDWNRLPDEDSFKSFRDQHPTMEFLDRVVGGALCWGLILDAVLESSIQLESFSAGCSRHGVGHLHLTDIDDLEHSFVGLTSLTLVLERDTILFDADRDEVEVAHFVDFLRMLAPSLKRLNLSREYREESSRDIRRLNVLFRQMCASLTMPVLEELELSTFDAPYDRIVAFLARHAKRLRHYCLTDVLATDCKPDLTSDDYDRYDRRLREDLRIAGLPVDGGTLEFMYEVS